jgi:hypothetical protein
MCNGCGRSIPSRQYLKAASTPQKPQRPATFRARVESATEEAALRQQFNGYTVQRLVVGTGTILVFTRRA